MRHNEGKWEKILWKSQRYEDNYIHPDYFLDSLRRNPNFRPYTYWPLVLQTCAITQHVSLIFIFLGIFLRLKSGHLDPRHVLWSSIGTFCVGYLCWATLTSRRHKSVSTDRHSTSEQHLKAVRSSILVFLTLMSLSPILRTLTAATSSDSIWAMSAILFILNILLTDYSPLPANEHGQARLSSVLSINAAVSGSVVLASRLSTDMSVLALVLCSVVSFACFPILRRLIQGSSSLIWIALTIMLSAFAIALTVSVSITFMYLSLSTLFVVTFVAPAMLTWAQKFKNEIRGPWDVAVPIVD